MFIQGLRIFQQFLPDPTGTVHVSIRIEDIIHSIRNEYRLENALVHIFALASEKSAAGSAIAFQSVQKHLSSLVHIGLLAGNVEKHPCSLSKCSLSIRKRRFLDTLSIWHVLYIEGIESLGIVEI